MSEQLLVVRDVSKRFPVSRTPLGRPKSWLSAVEAVSLEIGPGEAVGLVGESGSGKSTLIRLLVRLLTPTSGSIAFGGIDFAAATRAEQRELARRIQLVFQDPQSSLDPRMRLEAIVGEGLYHARLTKVTLRQRVGELLDLVGLSPEMRRLYPHQLSGGQRQRVGIARALAAEPELLLADEPVSALDASVQGQILNLLRTLQRERQLSLVFVAHELPVARFMSDRVAVMHLGRIVEQGPSDALFERPLHPYTQALLAALPTYGRAGGRRLVLRGDAPSPIDPPAACRFASRCSRRIDRCTAEEPELAPGDTAAHEISCFNWTAEESATRWSPSLSSS